jgi:hypothetical protein
MGGELESTVRLDSAGVIARLDRSVFCLLDRPVKPGDDSKDSVHVIGTSSKIGFVSLQRRPCLPSTLTVLACGPFSPISSKNATRMPGATCREPPLRRLFL